MFNFFNRQPLTCIIVLSQEYSDHSPFILKPYVDNFVPSPFRVFNSWLFIQDFNGLFKISWESFRWFGTLIGFLLLNSNLLRMTFVTGASWKSKNEQSNLIQLKKKVEYPYILAKTRVLDEFEQLSRKEDMQKVIEIVRLVKLDL